VFTGIIQSTGEVVAIEPLGLGRRVTVAAPALGLDDVAVGDSIATNGACMTVIAKTATTFSFDVSAESLARTAGLDRTGPVNLEKALKLGDRLDGHLVSGHVDATGIVRTFAPHGESWTLVIEVPVALAGTVAVKGSLTVDGVSLTVNRVDDERANGRVIGCTAWINLIPHTVAVTTLGRLRAGDRVNLEVDLIARHVARLLEIGGGALPAAH
jgi:riboflavin synthase